MSEDCKIKFTNADLSIDVFIDFGNNKLFDFFFVKNANQRGRQKETKQEGGNNFSGCFQKRDNLHRGLNAGYPKML